MRFWKTERARLGVDVGGVSLSRGWIVGAVVVLAALALSPVAASLADGSASTPPQVVSLSYSPSSADVTNGSVPVTFTAHFTDSSDIQSASIWLQSRSASGQAMYAYFSRVSGTAQDGIWQATINLPQGAAAGAWDYNGSISDAVNHLSFSESSYGDQNLPADVPGPLTVTDSTPSSPPPGADAFSRPNSSSLGAGWAAMTDGGLAISGGQAVGTSPADTRAISGSVRVYGSDQYSQVVLTSTQLTSGQWVGPTVRSQNGGQNTYVGIYFWSSAGPELELFKRSGGKFSQIGNSYPVAPLPAGTVLTVVAVGSQISFLENGIERITATDNTITGGNPGLMTYGTPSAASWTGDDATATNPALQYSVGGTVTGLSGSVVLQDNGGDDLTLSGNGPFQFQTPLADGTNYHVAITNSPAGLTCRITNADGTIASASVTNIAISCLPPPPGADAFSRPNSSSLGAGWAAMTDGGLAISGGQAVGTSPGGHSGDIRVGEVYGSDQYSQVVLTSTQLTAGQWVGPTVRSQNGGQDTYLGIYFWQDGHPMLELYKRSGGKFSQIGNSYPVAPLPAGTVLTVVAVGSQISFLENGIDRITATDNTITGGNPGLMTYGTTERRELDRRRRDRDKPGAAVLGWRDRDGIVRIGRVAGQRWR